MLTAHRRLTTALILACVAGLVALAAPASAQRPAPDFGPPNAPGPIVQAASTGSPLWIFAAVVLITAVLTAATVLAVPRFKAAHQGWLTRVQPHQS